MDELADSRSLASDPAALRPRLAADGYVFLRRLLPAERVRAAGEQVAATLAVRRILGPQARRPRRR